MLRNRRTIKITFQLIALLYCISISTIVWAQSNNSQTVVEPEKKVHPKKKDAYVAPRNKSMVDAAEKAVADYKTDESSAAQSFVTLGDELSAKGEHQKAETNYKRAIDIYTSNNNQTELAEAQRKLAKSQEALNKPSEAYMNYSRAASNQNSSMSKDLNINDASRVRTSNLEKKEAFARKNVEILSQTQGNVPISKLEMTDALTQLATTQQLQKKNDEAFKTLSKAVTTDKDIISKTEKVAENLTQALAKENNFDAAINLQKQFLRSADSSGNSESKIGAFMQLGNLYAQQKMDPLAEENLLSAYHLSKSLFLTKATKDAIQALVQFYNSKQQYAKAQQLSNSFIENLDELLSKDSSLMDMKAFEATEKRIQILEEEKALQASVIQQTQRNNYLLIAIAAVILVSLGILAKAYLGISKRNKQIKLQSLRREMNPHFVFNSLNSVNQFIAENDEIKANKYLSSYSTLMRTIMEHSGKDFVPLAVELDHLEKYLGLEHQRFSSQFEFKINIDKKIDKSETLIPNMIVQPFLENAVWHGLRYKKEQGLLTLKVQEAEGKINIEIEDNGIGIAQSQLLKTKNQKRHKSLGMANTMERIALLNQIYKTNITCEVNDLTISNGHGTKVTICLPLKHNIS